MNRINSFFVNSLIIITFLVAIGIFGHWYINILNIEESSTNIGETNEIQIYIEQNKMQLESIDTKVQNLSRTDKDSNYFKQIYINIDNSRKNIDSTYYYTSTRC